MRNYERLSVLAFLGAVVGYFAGLLTVRMGGGLFVAVAVLLGVTTAALYGGWLWAQAGDQ
jgi:hypothetical protein